MIESIIALLLIVNDKIVEHRIQDSLSQCLKHKRELTRNMDMGNKNAQCISSEAEVEVNIDGTKTIKKLIME
jgi:bacterioferritin-associated ferredoxin